LPAQRKQAYTYLGIGRHGEAEYQNLIIINPVTVWMYETYCTKVKFTFRTYLTEYAGTIQKYSTHYSPVQLLYSVAILLYVQIATFVYAKAMTRLHRHSARPARFDLFSPSYSSVAAVNVDTDRPRGSPYGRGLLPLQYNLLLLPHTELAVRRKIRSIVQAIPFDHPASSCSPAGIDDK
jgi:hypothetical protein